jgi:hypothetical protein
MFNNEFPKLSKTELREIRSLMQNAVESIDQGLVDDIGAVAYIVHYIRNAIIDGGRSYVQREQREIQFDEVATVGIENDSVAKLQAVLRQ